MSDDDFTVFRREVSRVRSSSGSDEVDGKRTELDGVQISSVFGDLERAPPLSAGLAEDESMFCSDVCCVEEKVLKMNVSLRFERLPFVRLCTCNVGAKLTLYEICAVSHYSRAVEWGKGTARLLRMLMSECQCANGAGWIGISADLLIRQLSSLLQSILESLTEILEAKKDGEWFFGERERSTRLQFAHEMEISQLLGEEGQTNVGVLMYLSSRLKRLEGIW
jgi:hypothetical protein